MIGCHQDALMELAKWVPLANQCRGKIVEKHESHQVLRECKPD